jgi:WD40 repeat protein
VSCNGHVTCRTRNSVLRGITNARGRPQGPTLGAPRVRILAQLRTYSVRRVAAGMGTGQRPSASSLERNSRVLFERNSEGCTMRGTKVENGHHRGPVTGTAAVPGTRHAVSSGYDSGVGLVDLDARTIRLMGYHDHLVNGVCVSPSGRIAATSSSDHTVGLWDCSRAERFGELSGHTDDVEAFAFIDEQTGVSASRDHSLIVWDLSTRQPIRRFEGHDKDALSVDYMHGTVISSGDDQLVRLWDLASGEQVHQIGPFGFEVDTCAADSARQRLIVGCDDGHVRTFNLSGSLLSDHHVHSSGVKRVAVDVASGRVLSSAYDQRLLIFDPSDSSPPQELGRDASVWERSLSWTGDGTHVLGGTFDGNVVEWDLDHDTFTTSGDGVGNSCLNDVAACDGDLATVGDDGIVRLIRVQPNAASQITAIVPTSGRVLMNAVALDAHRIATGSHDQNIFVIDRTHHDQQIRVNLHAGPINSVRFVTFAGRDHLVAATYSGDVILVDIEALSYTTIAHHGGAVKAVAVTPQGDIVSVAVDGSAQHSSLAGKQLSVAQPHEDIINDVAISPSGELCATVSRDFRICLMRLAPGLEVIGNHPLPPMSPKTVRFASEDLVIIGDYWGGITSLSLATGRIIRRDLASNGISSLALTPSWMAASSYDGAVYLIDPNSLAMVGQERLMYQRPVDMARQSLHGGPYQIGAKQ